MAERDALHLQEKQLDKVVPKTEEAVHKTSGGGTNRKPSQNCYRCAAKHRGSCRKTLYALFVGKRPKCAEANQNKVSHNSHLHLILIH